MSRVAKAPVTIPAGVEVTLNGQELSIKGGKGSLVRSIHAGVEVTKEDNVLKFAPRDGIAGADAQAGTARALANNMVICVTQGFERKLQLVGQVAADIRSYRAPEPYKGKGVRYANEQVRTKEAKKK